MKTSQNVGAQIATRHFSAKTVATLATRGIRLLGTVALPDNSSPMPWASAETGFSIDDNGCGKVWTRADVAKAAA